MVAPRGPEPLAVPDECPSCGTKRGRDGGELQAHTLSIWCMRCGWATNRYKDPATGKYTQRDGFL